MKRHFSNGRSIAIMAAAFFSLFLFTLVLSVVPHLHERVHSSSGAANHQCAVTLLNSGNYQHTVSDTIAIAPPLATAFAHVCSRFQLVSPRLEFSLLEHAPPAIS
jgi:hypothetical protein